MSYNRNIFTAGKLLKNIKSRAIFTKVLILLLLVGFVQIMIAPSVDAFRQKSAQEPLAYTFFFDQDGKKFKRLYTGVDFKEARVDKQSVSVLMLFAGCHKFSRYRFWVGLNGLDSRLRQPKSWDIWVRGGHSIWEKVGSEDIVDEYKNGEWYEFSFRTPKTCVSEVRMDIRALSGSEILRLYRFQIFENFWEYFTRVYLLSNH